MTFYSANAAVYLSSLVAGGSNLFDMNPRITQQLRDARSSMQDKKLGGTGN
jgi:hypothetical protein